MLLPVSLLERSLRPSPFCFTIRPDHFRRRNGRAQGSGEGGIGAPAVSSRLVGGLSECWAPETTPELFQYPRKSAAIFLLMIDR